MASKDYLKLCEEAQRQKLKLAKKQEKQIKEIYENMYLKVSKRLSKVNPNTLSERYLEELKKVLEKEIRSSNIIVFLAIIPPVTIILVRLFLGHLKYLQCCKLKYLQRSLSILSQVVY